MAVLRKLGNGRKVCFIGGSCFSPLWGLANYKILLVAMRGMHLWRVERPTSRSGDGKGARLPVNSRASLTSRREKNGEALGKTLGSLRMRGADVCNFFFFFSLPSFLRISYIVFTCVWMRYRSRLHYASLPRLDTRGKEGIEVAFFIAKRGNNLFVDFRQRRIDVL